MSVILINGINAKSGGGGSILKNYIEQLANSELEHTYFVLVPNVNQFKNYQSTHIKIVSTPSFYSNTILAPFVYEFFLNRIIKKLNCDLIFNLGDLIINSDVNQVYLFDWSYAVYTDHEIWSQMDFMSWINRKLKLFMINRRINQLTSIIAQTSVVKKRLEEQFELKNISVVPNAVSFENLDSENELIWKVPNGIKLLYLTYYYPHKNIEILIPLAKLIKKRKLDYKLIITIEECQHPGAKNILDEIKNLSLDDVIVNIGFVESQFVPNIYRECDGLLMPTLLESFSGTYVEAMYHKLPIFTSDYDFATGVCGDAACYFDPKDEYSILNSLEVTFNSKELMKEKIIAGQSTLAEMLSWKDTFPLYQRIIEKAINRTD